MTVSVVLRKDASGEGVADEVKANLKNSFASLSVTYPDIHVQFINNIERNSNSMGKVKLVQSNVKRDINNQRHGQ